MKYKADAHLCEQMTIISSLARNLSEHTELTNLVRCVIYSQRASSPRRSSKLLQVILRAIMTIIGLVPTPSDALVTSVTFHVKRRKLLGILAEFDALEDGTRELTGEWVVGRRLWTRMQHEWSNNHDGRSRMGTRRKERVMLYLHGGALPSKVLLDPSLLTQQTSCFAEIGAYYVMSAATHRPITIRLSKVCGMRVFGEPELLCNRD